jgi:hypothetical protein
MLALKYPRPQLWQQLNVKDHEFRILVLEKPIDDASPCRGSLLTRSLDRHPIYDAISWAWGSPHAHQVIELTYTDEYGMPESANWLIPRKLDACLRKLSTLTPERTFWVDAICINQQDDDERARQVQLMDLIFSRARTVWAWLGWKAVGTWNTDSFCTDSERSPPPAPGKNKSGASVFDASIRESLHDEWWYRVWPVQEVILANRLRICLRDRVVDIEEISRALQTFQTSTKSLLQELILLHGFRALTQSMGNDSQCREVTKLLFMTRHRSTSNPRDRVYGLLGVLTFLFGREFIRADYGRSVADIYHEFAFKLIDRTGSLAVLNQALGFASTQPMPSWVPDLDSRYEAYPEICRSESWLTYNASWQLAPRLIYGDDSQPAPKRLRCEAILFDAILSSPGDLRESWRSREVDELRRHWCCILSWLAQYHSFATSSTWATDDAVIRYGAPLNFLRTFATTVMRGSPSSSDTWESFLACWPFSFPRGTNKAEQHAVFAPASSYAAQWLDNAMSNTSQQWIGTFVNYVCQRHYSRLRPSQVSAWSCDDDLWPNTAMQRFFVTHEGKPGLGPPNTQFGDVVAILAGGRVPYVLRLTSMDDEYTLVGEAYVLDAMQGEVGDTGKKSQTIYLV